LLALVLAMTGLYGVLSWLVAQRTREMGIRMALGAQRAGVIQLVLKQGMLLVGAGMAVGLVASVAASRALKGMIYDLSPLDPLALMGATGCLLLSALFACWLPARRAARVNPMVALRCE
jgi:ABC-type antimicrobial peptide transport system permease subunit